MSASSDGSRRVFSCNPIQQSRADAGALGFLLDARAAADRCCNPGRQRGHSYCIRPADLYGLPG
jgi:hypothetical protein